MANLGVGLLDLGTLFRGMMNVHMPFYYAIDDG